MAGVTDSATPRPRRARDAAASTAAIAAATTDAIASTGEPAPLPVPAASEADAVALDPAAVLPDPTLTAEPGMTPPVVTASPPLAVEPSAIDVARMSTAGGATDVASTAPGTSVAGQPTLAIETSAADVPRDAPSLHRRAAGFNPAVADHAGIGGKVAVIEVVGPPQGRRRAGFAFGPEPRRFLATQLTMAQLAAIRDDRLLTVGVSEVDADAIDWSVFA